MLDVLHEPPEILWDMNLTDRYLWGWKLSLEAGTLPPVATERATDSLKTILLLSDCTDILTPDYGTRARVLLSILETPPKVRFRFGYVYFLRAGRFVKIGRTIKPSRRIARIVPLLPFEARLYGLVPAYDAIKAEQFFHDRFADKRANGEWFTLGTADLRWIAHFPGIRKDYFEAMFEANMDVWDRKRFQHAAEAMEDHDGA